MKSSHRLFLVFLILPAWGESSRSQTPPPLNFYPYRSGNVWQYRNIFTNEIVWTRYNDRDSLGGDGTIFIRGHRAPEGMIFERIDTAANVFDQIVSPANPVYKLNADTGNTWQGWQNMIVIRLVAIEQAIVFGRVTTVKQFSFANVLPPPREPLVFRRDYLAAGFGLVQAYYEPGLFLSLAGAIIDSVRWGVIVGVNEQAEWPSRVSLDQNYPNPFNPITAIDFDVPQSAPVHLAVFDILGRDVTVLVNGEKERGSHTVVFSAQGIASGVYFYRLKVGTTTLTKKMIVQK